MEGTIKTAHDITERPRTDDVLNVENCNVDFASLLLSGPVLEGLQGAGFQRPSPIQLKAIPLGRCGLDLVIQAKSGTGKTCVFSVIALESVDLSSSSTQVLILAPTREIAVQIQQVILDIGRMMPSLRCHVFIGGTLIGPDKQNLKKCHIAVGTPGRLKQLIETGVLVPDSIRLFILDEADKLLDDKFQSQINWIYNELPYNKQMLAASATYPEYLAQHLTTYMRDATFVRLNPKEIALHGIRQYYKLVEGHELPHKSFAVKVNELITLLSNVTFQQCLVFSNLHTRAENLCDILCQRGWQSVFMSGGLEQKQRLHAMSTFKKFECRVLISTDLTARGIDAEKVNLVINLDVPVDVKTYMHRIGRAGRFGTYGAAITLASFGREEILLHSIKKESHVPILLLPDPVPYDILSPSAEVSREPLMSKNFIPNSKDDYHDDKNTKDKLHYTSISRQSRLSATSALAKQSGDSSTVSCLNGESSHQDFTKSANLCFSMAPTKRPVMVDKGCQADDHNSVLNFITSEIPSLKETLNFRACHPTWSFSAALKEFNYFKKSGNFELETDNKLMGKSIVENVNHGTRTFLQNKHMQSEKDIRRTVSPPDEDREEKKENELDKFQLQLSNNSNNRVVEEKIENDILLNMIPKRTIDGGIEVEQRAKGIRKILTEDKLLIRNIIDRCEEQLSCENEEINYSYSTGNLQFQDEQEDIINPLTKESLGKRKADGSCDQMMGTINQICNSKSDHKMYEESHRTNRKGICDTVIRNEDKAVTVRNEKDMSIMYYEEVEQVRISPNTTSDKVLWTEEEENEEEEEEEEEEAEESFDEETGNSIDESSNESITTENTSSSNDSEGESNTSQVDEEEEDSASNIYMIKDGVVIKVSSKRKCLSRQTVNEEIDDSSEDLENNFHCREVPEMEETTVLGVRRNVGDRWQETWNNRKKIHQQSRSNSSKLYNNNPYYDCSGYQYYGTVPGSHHQMSHMGYYAGQSYQDFGWSGWPYVWQMQCQPAYPAGIAGAYHQNPVAQNQGPEWYPPGQINVRQPRSQEYEEKY